MRFDVGPGPAGPRPIPVSALASSSATPYRVSGGSVTERTQASASASSGSSNSSSSSSPLDIGPSARPSRTVPSPPAHPVPTASGADSAVLNIQEGESEQYPPVSLTERLQDIMYEHSAVINTFIAGGLAGATSRTVVSPLERLKIIL